MTLQLATNSHTRTRLPKTSSSASTLDYEKNCSWFSKTDCCFLSPSLFVKPGLPQKFLFDNEFFHEVLPGNISNYSKTKF